MPGDNLNLIFEIYTTYFSEVLGWVTQDFYTRNLFTQFFVTTMK